jgi:alginate O-acetyltransferase complex protein AlgI
VFFIVLGWSIFYFTDLSRLGSTLQVMFGFTDVPLYDFELDVAIWANAFWLVFALVMCAPLYARAHTHLQHRLSAVAYQWTVVSQNLLFLGVSVVLLVGKTYNPFIYFRF